MKINLNDTDKIEEKVKELCSIGAIKLNHKQAANLIDLMVKKATNNLKFAKTALKISDDKKTKEILGLSENDSFYDWVIAVSYYAMFHITHALLATKEIRIIKIRVHEATLYALAKYFIINKELEDDLFFIYEDAEAKAEELFASLSEERKKRGQFTYERLPKANRMPAEESLKNATEFVRAIETVLKRRKYI